MLLFAPVVARLPPALARKRRDHTVDVAYLLDRHCDAARRGLPSLQAAKIGVANVGHRLPPGSDKRGGIVQYLSISSIAA